MSGDTSDEARDDRPEDESVVVGGPPPKPTGPVPPPPETLPTTHWLSADEERGAIVTMDGDGVTNDAVEVRVMSRILEHFERLVRILRAHKSGLEVKRRGRIVEVQGAARLVAVGALGGSYVVPLRLEVPESELLSEDHGELEEAVGLLDLEGDALFESLAELPERVGDELVGLLEAAADGRIDLQVDAYKKGETTATASVSTERASSTTASLEDLLWSEPGVDHLRGILFRIDTKRLRIAIDAELEDDEVDHQIVEAVFPIDMLEALRTALHGPVEIEVIVVEQRRRYERSARTRSMTVTAMRSLRPQA